jgi:hypothetical protein
MQRAMLLHSKTTIPGSQEQLLREAMNIIQRVETEETRLYADNVPVKDASPKPSKLPPPPILLCRTEISVTLKPAPFNPTSGQKVCANSFLFYHLI